MKESENENSKKMPLWVLLAFSSIQKRKHAIFLIRACIVFTVYSLPWSTLFNNDALSILFLINDWSWAGMMAPICIWYFLALRWMDNNACWE